MSNINSTHKDSLEGIYNSDKNLIYKDNTTTLNSNFNNLKVTDNVNDNISTAVYEELNINNSYNLSKEDLLEYDLIKDINIKISTYFLLEDIKNLELNLNTGCFAEVINYLNKSYYYKQIKDPIIIQMIASIHLYCLIKLKKYDQIKLTISQCMTYLDILKTKKDANNKIQNYNNQRLYSFDYLVAKSCLINVISDVLSGISKFHLLKEKYEKTINFNKEDKNNLNIKSCFYENIDWEIMINYKYFSFFFENLFSIKNTHNKIKKCYFEIKNGFHKLGLNIEACNIISKLYNKFPEDPFIIFESYKYNLNCGNFKKANILYNKLFTINNGSTNKYNYLIKYSDFLKTICNNDYNLAFENLLKLINKSSEDLLITNNKAVLHFYNNNIDKCLKDFNSIIDKNQLNLYNEVSYYNLSLINDCISSKK